MKEISFFVYVASGRERTITEFVGQCFYNTFFFVFIFRKKRKMKNEENKKERLKKKERKTWNDS